MFDVSYHKVIRGKVVCYLPRLAEKH